MRQDSLSYNSSDNDIHATSRNDEGGIATPQTEREAVDTVVPKPVSVEPVVKEDTAQASRSIEPVYQASSSPPNTNIYGVRNEQNPVTVSPIGITDSLQNGVDTVRAQIVQTIKKEDKAKIGNDLPFKIEHIDGIFIVLLICFLFFVRNYNGGGGFIKEKVKQIFSANIVWRPLGYSSFNENTTSYFLLFQFLILVSVILYDVLMVAEPIDESLRTPFVTLMLMAVAVGLYLVLKVCLYQFIGFVFDVSSDMKSWIRTYLVVFETLGVVLFVPTLLLVYSDYWSVFFLGTVIILLIVAHLILFFKLIAFFISEKFNFLYLISYLCALEIIPLVFLARGLVYLYRFDVLTYYGS